MGAVLVEEKDPPPETEPIVWRLLTDLPIDRPADIRPVIHYYSGHWPMEPFFRTLKTGCKVEQLHLETADRLKKCVALYLIVAWRVQFVTMLGREYPDLPADALLADEEWKSVWQIVE